MLPRKFTWIAVSSLVVSSIIFLLGSDCPGLAKANEANIAKAKELVSVAYDHCKRREFASAIKVLCNAVRIDPDNLLARRSLAYALLYSGSPVCALEQTDLLARMTPPTVYDLCLRGEALLNKGDYEQSKSCFEKVLAVQPDYHWALGGVIKATALQGDYESSLHMCQVGFQKSKDKSEKDYYLALQAFVQKIKAQNPSLAGSPAPAAPTTLPQNKKPNTPLAPGQPMTPLLPFPSPTEIRGIMGARG